MLGITVEVEFSDPDPRIVRAMSQETPVAERAELQRQFLQDSIRHVKCPAHGRVKPKIVVLNQADHASIYFEPCCESVQSKAQEAFESAWFDLLCEPNARSIVQTANIHIFLSEVPGYDLEEQLNLRQAFREQLLIDLKDEECHEHGFDTNMSLDFNHKSDGRTEIVPHACCDRMENRMRSFIFAQVDGDR